MQSSFAVRYIVLFDISRHHKSMLRHKWTMTSVMRFLQKLQDDDIGHLCRTDPVILTVGKRDWDKLKRKAEKKSAVRRSVMTDMSRLSSLYFVFRKQGLSENSSSIHVEGTAADMLKRKYFSILESAIQAYIARDKDVIKPGLKLSLDYLPKTACKIMKATYLMDEKAAELDRFLTVLEINHNYLFGDATYAINKGRQTKL